MSKQKKKQQKEKAKKEFLEIKAKRENKNKKQDALRAFAGMPEDRQKVIDADIEAFLKKGGRINKIPKGVSGQDLISRGRVQIVLTPSRKAKDEPLPRGCKD